MTQTSTEGQEDQQQVSPQPAMTKSDLGQVIAEAGAGLSLFVSGSIQLIEGGMMLYAVYQRFALRLRARKPAQTKPQTTKAPTGVRSLSSLRSKPPTG